MLNQLHRTDPEHGTVETQRAHYANGVLNGYSRWDKKVKYSFSGGRIEKEESYRGYYQNGKRHGKGKYSWKNKVDKESGYYDGEWSQGEYHGQGKLHRGSKKYSTTYRGTFVKGTKEGKGYLHISRYRKSSNTRRWSDNYFKGLFKAGYCVDGSETWNSTFEVDSTRYRKAKTIYSKGNFLGTFKNQYKHNGRGSSSRDKKKTYFDYKNGKQIKN